MPNVHSTLILELYLIVVFTYTDVNLAISIFAVQVLFTYLPVDWIFAFSCIFS